ncbi:MAG: hypothetical protein K5799_03920 [Erythrobacter sp.]|nr:hypothetical protein [Erythrobacter sp.]
MIPKVFHLTAKSKTLPPHFQKNVDRIRELYPDHDIVIHDDADIMRFLKSADPAYFEQTIVKMPKFIMVIDTVRYLWMRELGGIYCDMDIFFQRRLDFGDAPFFIAREWTWPTDHRIADSVHNCIFASPPGHPIWTDILDGIAQNIAIPPRETTTFRRKVKGALANIGLAKRPESLFSPVFNTTGPNAISKIITDRQLRDRYPDVIVASPSMIFQQNLSRGSRDGAAVVHETAGSWSSIG